MENTEIENKSEQIQAMTEKQKTEALLYVSGVKKGTPTTKRVRAYFESESENASKRMVWLSKQDGNLNVAFNATNKILELSGVTSETKESEIIPIGIEEAELILMRRVSLLKGKE